MRQNGLDPDFDIKTLPTRLWKHAWSSTFSGRLSTLNKMIGKGQLPTPQHAVDILVYAVPNNMTWKEDLFLAAISIFWSIPALLITLPMDLLIGASIIVLVVASLCAAVAVLIPLFLQFLTQGGGFLRMMQTFWAITGITMIALALVPLIVRKVSINIVCAIPFIGPLLHMSYKLFSGQYQPTLIKKLVKCRNHYDTFIHDVREALQSGKQGKTLGIFDDLLKALDHVKDHQLTPPPLPDFTPETPETTPPDTQNQKQTPKDVIGFINKTIHNDNFVASVTRALSHHEPLNTQWDEFTQYLQTALTAAGIEKPIPQASLTEWIASCSNTLIEKSTNPAPLTEQLASVIKQLASYEAKLGEVLVIWLREEEKPTTPWAKLQETLKIIQREEETEEAATPQARFAENRHGFFPQPTETSNNNKESASASLLRP